MIRAVLIALLCGMLIGGGVTSSFAYIALHSESERLAGIEADLRTIKRGFNMGMQMSADGTPVTPAVAQAVRRAGRASPAPRRNGR